MYFFYKETGKPSSYLYNETSALLPYWLNFMLGLHQTSFNTKSVFFHFPERPVYEDGWRQRAEEKKFPAPSWIRTHELLTSSHVV